MGPSCLDHKVCSKRAAITQIQTIKLGLDVHADSIVAVRILDGQSPQPAQRFKPDAFLEWIQKLLGQDQVGRGMVLLKFWENLCASSKASLRLALNSFTPFVRGTGVRQGSRKDD